MHLPASHLSRALSGPILGFFALFFLAVPSARAWDQHRYLTQPILEGFAERDPKLWKELRSEVDVVSLDEFLALAFGARCTLERAKTAVFDGLGKDYEVRYPESYRFNLAYDEKDGSSVLKMDWIPSDPAQSRNAIGKKATPLSIVTLHSDEPDWKLDDDVPRLKDVGVTQGIRGTGTRILRHFWYEGQSIFPGLPDPAAGQETDRRMQLYYELSTLAFQLDQPYWGYRFLGIALHYLQDVFQPFHSKFILDSDFTYPLSAVRSGLCDIRRTKIDRQHPPTPDLCPPGFTMDAEVLRSATLTSSYHAAYEDFVRGLYTAPWALDQPLPHGTSGWVTLADPRRVDERWGARVGGGEAQVYDVMDPLPRISRADKPGLIDAREILRAEAAFTEGRAGAISKSILRALGRFQEDTPLQTKLIREASQWESAPFLFGLMNANDLFSPLLTSLPPQFRVDRKAELADQTGYFLRRMAYWTRQFVQEVRHASQNPEARQTLARERAEWAQRCR